MCWSVRFLDIDGEVATAAVAFGCRRVSAMEVEDNDDVKESSDATLTCLSSRTSRRRRGAWLRP
jgi:hypothetical protein